MISNMKQVLPIENNPTQDLGPCRVKRTRIKSSFGPEFVTSF